MVFALSPGVKAWDQPNADEPYKVYKGTTCSGQEAGSVTQTYVFGYRGTDGYCMTRILRANSGEEAMQCAQAYCTTCEVEDVTNQYVFSTSVPGMTHVGYCNKKE